MAGVTDFTDSRLLAEHLEWAATTSAAQNQALHIVNGDVFRWKWMWPRLADYFGLEPVAFNGEEMPLTEQMAGAEPVWAELAKKHGLIEPDLDKVASFWHTDGDLLRPFECITDMTKSRKLGFDRFQASDESFLDLFQRLKAERVVPSR